MKVLGHQTKGFKPCLIEPDGNEGEVEMKRTIQHVGIMALLAMSSSVAWNALARELTETPSAISGASNQAQRSLTVRLRTSRNYSGWRPSHTSRIRT